MGIIPEHLSHIFEQFYQTNDALQLSQGGLGMGLTLVRAICDLHGGTVDAHSDGPQKGSEFIIRLPVSSAELPAQLSLVEPLMQSTVGKMKILVVDDNRDLAKLMGKLLQMHGFDVRTCFDGISALAEADAFDPEVVILDIGMFDMDGYAVARELRKREEGRACKRILVAVSGYGQRDDIKKAIESGFDRHMVKPINIAELKALLSGAKEEQD
ncbi:MAG: Signal Transduction Histidine Kinase (STHK) with CheB and CheR activity [Parcubacteria group bacterium GW2011_GWA2_47_7]|nr:MAG: Signal Transduction Histidine Kinase (STHK) with CheB and CheR activity [Parcubacteria group bacterium GW2011_GWA2_47_7]